MNHERFIKLAKKKVAELESARLDYSFDEINVFVVWSCKTLQNSKALLSLDHDDAYYYEMTLNGDKEEIYVDGYEKKFNVVVNYEGDLVER